MKVSRGKGQKRSQEHQTRLLEVTQNITCWLFLFMIITVILSVCLCLYFTELQMLCRHLSLIFIRPWEENSIPQEVPSEREEASRNQQKGRHGLCLSPPPHTCLLTPTMLCHTVTEMGYNTTQVLKG